MIEKLNPNQRKWNQYRNEKINEIIDWINTTEGFFVLPLDAQSPQTKPDSVKTDIVGNVAQPSDVNSGENPMWRDKTADTYYYCNNANEITTIENPNAHGFTGIAKEEQKGKCGFCPELKDLKGCGKRINFLWTCGDILDRPNRLCTDCISLQLDDYSNDFNLHDFYKWKSRVVSQKLVKDCNAQHENNRSVEKQGKDVIVSDFPIMSQPALCKCGHYLKFHNYMGDAGCYVEINEEEFCKCEKFEVKE